MKYIVSGNYNNRNEPVKGLPWLVRRVGQHPLLAVPHGSVLAQGVFFAPSTHYELGFGCVVVAYCQSVILNSTDIEPRVEQVRLSFVGQLDRYFVDPNGKPVHTCANLLLRPDGKMYASGKSLSAPARLEASRILEEA